MDSNEYQHFDRFRNGEVGNLHDQGVEFLRLLPHIERENMNWREYEAADRLAEEIRLEMSQLLKQVKARGGYYNETPAEPTLLEKMKVLEAHASNAYNKFCARQEHSLRWAPKCVPAWG